MSLLEEILANPDDDELRRVYADQLVERGDPRGELILLQLANADAHEAHARVAEDIWHATGLVVKLDRGFVRSIEGTAQQIIAARDIFKREPIVELRVVPASNMRAVFELHELEQIEKLVVCKQRDASFGDAMAAQLAACDRFRVLRALEIDQNQLRAEGVRAIANAPWLDGVRSLAFRKNHFGEAGVRALGESTRLSALTTFELADFISTYDDVPYEPIARAAPNIETLRLRSTRSMRSLGLTACALPRLEHLDLHDCSVFYASGFAELATTSFPALRRFSAVACNTYENATAAIVSVPWSLVELDLRENRIPDEGAYAIANGEHFGRLRRLDIAANRILSSGMRAIANSDRLPALEVLSLDLDDRVRALFAHRPELQLTRSST